MSAPTSAPEPPPLSATHVPALDGLRGVAILMVVAYHFYAASTFIVEPSGIALDRAATRVFEVGWSGVDLFFVLSGFLITGILLDAKAGHGYFRNFYARRILRIFPLYYGFLFVLIVLLPLLPRLSDNADLDILVNNQVWYWTYLINFWFTFDPPTQIGLFGNGHLWSLAIEEQFYLVWPIVVLLAPRRMFVPLCGALVATALVLRIVLVQGWFPEASTTWGPIMLMPARMDTLALGALLAAAAREPALLLRLRSWALPIAAAGIGVCVVLSAWRGEFSLFDETVVTVGLTALALLFAAVLLIAVTAAPGDAVHRSLTPPLLRAFGKYSYAMYVLHLQISLLWVDWAARTDTTLPLVLGSALPVRLAVVAAGIAVSLALAWCTWHLYEKQFLKLKRYFEYRRAAGSAESREAARADDRAVIPAP